MTRKITFAKKCEKVRAYFRLNDGSVTNLCKEIGIRNTYYYSAIQKREYEKLNDNEKKIFDRAWEITCKKELGQTVKL